MKHINHVSFVLIASGIGMTFAVNSSTLKPSFADLSWNFNRKSVSDQLVKRGYSLSGNISDTGAMDLSFSGILPGNSVTVRAWFNNNNQLVQTTIVFKKAANEIGLYAQYATVKSNLDSKYGEGITKDTLISEERPYDSLVSHDISTKAAVVQTIWEFNNLYSIGASLQKPYTNLNQVDVVLEYESPFWMAEHKPRDQGSGF